MLPSISVVIPTFNRNGLLQVAIDSVLLQTFPVDEIIVVDDGSTDGTHDALRKYAGKIHYMFQENQGESVARNNGIEYSSGEFVAFLDSDDMWHPEKLEWQMALFQQFPDVGLVCCRANRIEHGGAPLPGDPIGIEVSEGNIGFDDICRHNLPAGGSTAVVRRRLLEAIGGFDPAVQYGEDWDLWLRCALKARCWVFARPLADIRLHNGGQWWFPKPHQVQDSLKDHLYILEKAFAAWPDKSADAWLLRNQCFAREYGKAALVNYMWEDWCTANQQMQVALELDAAHWGDQVHISQEVINLGFLLGQVPSMDDSQLRCRLENLFNGLQRCSGAPRVPRRKLLARISVELAYSFCGSNEQRRARGLLTQAMFSDPTWLGNLGVVTRLVKLWLNSDISTAKST